MGVLAGMNSWLVPDLLRALIAIGVAGVGILACQSESNVSENPFVIVRTPTARISEATSIVRVRIGTSRPLTFDEADGGRGICGYHARAETLRILDGTPVDRDFISNTPLPSGDEYVVAILDMRGRLPEIVDNPEVSEDDRNFARCRDRYEQYSLGSAHIVTAADGTELIDIESSDLVPQTVLDSSVSGTVNLDQFLEAILLIRRE